MYRYATVAIAVAVGLTASAPPALRAQYRATRTFAATTQARVYDARQPAQMSRPLAKLALAYPDTIRHAHSLGRHLLVGAGAGAAAGLAIGFISRNHSSECTECVPPTSAIPAAGAVVGAVAGTLVGWVVYVGRSGGAAESNRSRPASRLVRPCLTWVRIGGARRAPLPSKCRPPSPSRGDAWRPAA